jgi:peptidoglycan/xylan/chitin deacetylase (PgdA/CDA1 family)
MAILAPDPATFFLVANLVTGRSAIPHEPLFEGRRFGPPQAWKDLIAAGAEVQPHSVSYANLADLSPQDRLEEVQRSVEDIREIFGRANVFGFPYNALAPTDMASLDLIASGFQTINSAQPPLYHKLGDPIDPWRLRSWAVREVHFESIVRDLAELPDNSWIVLTFHSLDGEGHEPWSSESFRRLVAKLRELGFTARTIGEMAERIRSYPAQILTNTA